MKILDLIQEYKNKMRNNPNDISCLLFALQIPSICSRIEFPKTAENTGRLYQRDGRVMDKNMYKKWLQKHHNAFVDIYDNAVPFDKFCENLYSLRCQMTHEGVLMTESSKFYFTDGDNAMSIGDVVFIPVKRLCEDMFDAADSSLSDPRANIDITPSEDIVLSNKVYQNILNDTKKTYGYFWDSHTDDDGLLICIYYNIIFDNPSMKDEIDTFFKSNPNNIFEIWDFDYKYGCIVDINERFIHEEYDESKSSICSSLKTSTTVLRITKQQYERMLQVVQELECFSRNHPFDIKKYIKW